MAGLKPLSSLLRGVTRFGRLAVVGEGEPRIADSGYVSRMALVRCDCGAEKSVSVSALRYGLTRSCGCLQKEEAAAKRRAEADHGHARKRAITTEYAIWKTMRARCSNPKHDSYRHYGARGIRVCDRWDADFSAFLADMGLRPAAMSINRIDNDGHYEPGNCEWATDATQQNNRNGNRRIVLDGIDRTVTEWAAISGIARHTIYKRLQKGVPPRDAVFGPLRRVRR